LCVIYHVCAFFISEVIKLREQNHFLESERNSLKSKFESAVADTQTEKQVMLNKKIAQCDPNKL